MTLFALGVAGCADFSTLSSWDRMEHGLVVLLPGSAGGGWIPQRVGWGLKDAGVPYAILEDDWTTGVPLLWLLHMRGEKRNQREAARIAERIANYRSAYPGRPVHLIGHSSGAAMAVKVLETLPEGENVTDVVLLGAALSKDYDLTEAMRHVETRIWNFYSPLDWLILNAGTTLGGTADGRYTSCGGSVGFAQPGPPAHHRKRLYEIKLQQRPYSWHMSQHGHLGSHYGWLSREFARDYIAPILTDAHLMTTF